MDTITDYVTGKEVPDIGAEAARQAIERFLVDDRGFLKSEIKVDAALEISVAGEAYRSKIDLLISVGEAQKAVLLIKCAAGSLGSREREAIAAARVALSHQIPFAAASDGKTAVLLDTLTGKRLGSGLEAIPTRNDLLHRLPALPFNPYPADRIEREKLIFRSYDMMAVNVSR